MAEETTVDTTAIVDATAANKAYAGSIKAVDKGFTHMAERTLPRVARSLKEIQNHLGGKYLEVMATKAEVMQDKVSDAFFKAAKSGDAFSIKMAASMKGLTGSFAEATKSAYNLQERMKNSAQSYVGYRNQLSKTEDSLKKSIELLEQNKEAHEKLRIAYEQDGRQSDILLKQMQDAELGIAVQAEAVRNLAVEHQNLTSIVETTEGEIQNLAVEVKKAEKAMATYHEELHDVWMESHEVDAKQKQMAGGVSAFTGSAKLAILQTAKFRSALETLTKGGLFLVAMKLLGDAMSSYASYTQAARMQSIQMGDATAGLGNQFMNANKAIMNVTSTAGEFGESVETVSAITSKFRIGVVLDRNGKLGEAAISELTRTTLSFSKITGVDAAQAEEMLAKRIKTTGLSAAEAIGDMRDMQLALTAMAASNKNNNVPLKEMVNIIEEARESSNSYVVDTRLLTQALRGTATQAASMGANTKQATDVTKAMGKVFSKAPDYIKIPAGYDLIDKLMGGESNAFLAKYDEKTKTQLKGLEKQLKAGTITRFSAAKVMMDLIGGDEDAMSSLLDNMKGTLQGPAAVELIAEQYGIENMATANLVTQQLQSLVKAKEQFKGVEIGTIMSMVAQEAEFGTMLSELSSSKDKIEKLKTKGFSEATGIEYLASINEVAKKQKEIEEDKKNGGLESQKLGRELIELQVKQAKIAEGAVNPVKDVLRQAEKIKPGAVKGKGDDLKEALGKSDGTFNELADKIGLEGEARDKLHERWKKDSEKITALDVANAKTAGSKNLEAQNKMLSDFSAKMASGPIEGLYQAIQFYFPALMTPMGKMGLALAALGVVFLGTGKLLAKLFKIWDVKNYKAVKEGTRDGIKQAGGIGGGGGDQLSLPGSSKRGPKTHGGKVKQGWRVLKGKKGLRGKWAGAKAIMGGMAGGALSMATGGISDVDTDDDGGRSGVAEPQKQLPPAQEPGPAGQKELFPSKTETPAPSATPKGPGKFAQAKGWAGKKLSGAGSKIKGFGKALKGGGLASASKAKGLITGGFGMAMRGGKGSLGLLKKGLGLLKGARAIPLLGTLLGAGFAMAAAWELYSKWKQDPDSITSSDKVKMVASLAAMIPGIGSLVAGADIAADMSGAYDKLDASTAKSGGGSGGMPSASSVAGNATGMPSGGGTGMPTASLVAGAAIGSAAMAGVDGALGDGGAGGMGTPGGGGGGKPSMTFGTMSGKGMMNPDGSVEIVSTVPVTLKIDNYMDLAAQSGKRMAMNKPYV